MYRSEGTGTMSQEGVCFSVVGADGVVREREICRVDPEPVLRYLRRSSYDPSPAGGRLVGAAWRYGPLHRWQVGWRADAVPEPLLSPAFRRMQGLAYRRLEEFLTAREGPAAAGLLARLCGYFADVEAGVRSIVVHEIAPALLGFGPLFVRCVDMRTMVQDLLHAGAIEVLELPREAARAPEGWLPPGVFLLRT